MGDNIKVFWGEVESLVSNIADKMISADYKPDIVIAILRGGIVPARILCNYFEKASLFTVTAKLYDKVDDWQTEAGYMHDMGEVKVGDLYIDITGNEKTLIIDDISDSGKTFKAVLEEICNKYVIPYDNKNIKTASLYVREKSIFVPDFCGEKVKHGKWFDFPWEKKIECEKQPNFCAEIDGKMYFGYGEKNEKNNNQ